ncbi:hypothetical protein [Micromonospora chokoriensis]|uniref:Uncharacterized protein n=1 Tax=Micromonospora chokoriensis TaxID=356851 RepID=A0A1C4VG29_9ACTN|nr:hypothetical protein [Micromonospora chokoriensis]SCE82967.1 hypothetical protein GA0070612_1401 [Micromonospora chokoriensis]
MDTSAGLLVDAALLTLKVISVGTTGLYLATLGNPAELRGAAWIIRYLNAAPPTAIFRWRSDQGYEVVVYNAATDAEDVKPALFKPARWSPTYLLWPKRRPQPRKVMVRAALHAFVLRLILFFCFFLGSFCLLGWLAVTESPRWLAAMAVLAVDQWAFAHSDMYFVWHRWWLFAVVGAGVWVYLQGGTSETIAVCGVGVLVVLTILGRSYFARNWRFHQMRELQVGPFDPSRRRRLK